MDWRHTSSPTNTKFKQTTSTWKVKCTIFWDTKGVLLVDFVPQRSTINFRCRDTIKKLRCLIQNKRHGTVSRAVVMIHDNTCPHTAMQNLITTFGWEQFDHPLTAQTYRQVIFICSCILNPSLLAGRSTNAMRSRKPLPRSLHIRRHHCMMKGSKNWCSAMTSASTRVETMSQTSVEYVH